MGTAVLFLDPIYMAGRRRRFSTFIFIGESMFFCFAYYFITDFTFFVFSVIVVFSLFVYKLFRPAPQIFVSLSISLAFSSIIVAFDPSSSSSARLCQFCHTFLFFPPRKKGSYNWSTRISYGHRSGERYRKVGKEFSGGPKTGISWKKGERKRRRDQ